MVTRFRTVKSVHFLGLASLVENLHRLVEIDTHGLDQFGNYSKYSQTVCHWLTRFRRLMFCHKN